MNNSTKWKPRNAPAGKPPGGLVRDHHLKGLRELKKEHPVCKRRIVVSREPVSRKTNDGIEILSVEDYLAALWEGRLF